MLTPGKVIPCTRRTAGLNRRPTLPAVVGRHYPRSPLISRCLCSEVAHG